MKTLMIKELDDLRDRALWRFDVVDVTRIRSTWPGRRFDVQRQDDHSWKLADGTAADTSQVSQTLGRLETLRIQDFAATEAASLSDYGLKSSAKRACRIAAMPGTPVSSVAR